MYLEGEKWSAPAGRAETFTPLLGWRPADAGVLLKCPRVRFALRGPDGKVFFFLYFTIGALGMDIRVLDSSDLKEAMELV